VEKLKYGIAVLAIGIGGLGLALTSTGFRSLVFSGGVTAETRGWRLADELGCIRCHGNWGRGGVPNPGVSAIPELADFAFTMSVGSESELREWILDGAPARLREKPGYEASKAERAVVMPAYRGKISDGELEDLIAWYNVIASTVYPDDETAVSGYEAAERHGCFSCHGTGGRFDMPNGGSLVGRIPAWNGDDFTELARDEAEIRAWILDGMPQRLRDHPLAGLFLDHQMLAMPAYRDLIPERDIDAIVAYIHWLRDPTAPGHEPDYSEPGEAGFDLGFEDDY